jgi:hypothetical protein
MSSATSTDTLQPWQLFTLAGLIGATVVVFVSRGQTPAGIILLSLTIFAAAVVGLAAWRTRAALEREKTLVLRSIKELEFDRAMGKVSEKDFAEMSARLRMRAAGLIRQLDAGAVYREEIEKEIARRVKPSHSESSRVASKEATARTASGVCVACATANDADARFCKHCGASLGRTA